MTFNLVLVVPMLAIVVYAIAALASPRNWLDRPLYTPLPPQGRHRTTSVREPYRPRPWDEVTADGERLATPAEIIDFDLYDSLDPRVPLAEVERRMALLADVRPLMPISAPPAPSAVESCSRRDVADTGELVAIA